ncbi:MAG: hypothetical protein ABSB36_07165 [Candidatus Dormibacteria bacterium]|jgi:hypothetical protein
MPTPLSEALATLRRRHGEAVIRSGDALGGVEAWPTGLPVLDHRLTPGGLPVGRVSLLAAAPGASGRLTLLQALVAAASRERTAVYLDLVGSLDPGFLADLGADLSALLVLRPPSGRWGEGFSMVRSLVMAGAPWLAVALPAVGGATLATGGTSAIAGHTISPAAGAGSGPEGRSRPRSDLGWEHRLSTLVESVAARRAVCLISAASPLPAALGYASSLTLECAADGWEEAHGDVLGLRTHLTVVKSKVSTPGETAALLLRYPRPFAAAEAVGRPAVVDLTATRKVIDVPAVASDIPAVAG